MLVLYFRKCLAKKREGKKRNSGWGSNRVKEKMF